MTNKLVVGLLFWTVTSCSDKAKTTDVASGTATEPTFFRSVYDSLEKMEVPIVLTPGIWDSLYQIHVNKYGIGGQPDTILARPYKKLIDSEKFKAIIFVSIDELDHRS